MHNFHEVPMDMPDKLKKKMHQGRYGTLRIMRWGFILLAMFFTLFLSGYSWLSWKAVKADQSDELASIAELGGNALDSYFSQYEIALRALAGDITAMGETVDPARSRPLLERFLQVHPDILITNINRVDGQIIVSTENFSSNALPTQGNAPSYIAGRKLLEMGIDFDIGRATYGPLAKGWVMPLRHAIRDRSGKLLYVLVAVLPLSRQQSFWHDLKLPENTALGLLRDDAYLISRYPDSTKTGIEEAYGQPRTGVLVEYLAKNGFPPRGIVDGYNSVAKQEFLFGFRRLARFPITLFVATPITNVYMKWWQQVRYAYLLLLILLPGSYVVYRRTLSKQLLLEAERDLSEEKLRSIYDGSNDAILLLARSGIIDCNRKATEMFGTQEQGEMLARRLSDFSPPRQPDGRPSSVAEEEHVSVAFAAAADRFEWQFANRQGRNFLAEVRLTRFDYGGEPVLQATLRDITEQRNTELALQRVSASWMQAMDSFTDAIYFIDLERRLVRANKTFYAMLKLDPARVAGKHISEVVHPHGESMPCPVCKAQEQRVDAVITMEANHPDNAAGRPVEVTVKLIRDDAGQQIGTLVSVHDLSNIRSIEASLHESEARFRRVVAEAPLPMMIHAENGEVLEINKAWMEATGYTHEDIPDIASWVKHAYEENPQMAQDAKSVKELIERVYGIGHRIDQGERVIRCKDGSTRVWHFSAAPVGRLPDGRRYVVSMAQDISESKAAQKQIEFMAYHDALTGLPNRLLARNLLEQAILEAQRDGSKVALLFVDLDKFKTINDSLGHLVGDALLRAVAGRLRTSLREVDTLSRQGGDEFLIVLKDVQDSDSITVVTDKLMATMAEPVRISQHELSISLSIGIAVYPDDGNDFDTLLKKSDTAMYQSKESGRNTYRFHTEQMNIDATEHLRLRNGLRRALELGEFLLHYQPQLNIASGEVIGAEALLRWQHPELGMVAPGRFISIAEDSGLIVPISEWVIREACRQAMAWQKAGLPEILVAVNLSAVHFKRGDVTQSVLQALQETGLDPAFLELELTESILIKDTEKVLATVRQLKSMGLKLSIDDFGTGYSSLSYLKQFNVDKLKIDQSFVRDMADDPNDAAIVRAIIQMAKSLNLVTIAEGVEDERQLALLRLQQCDEVQGYYFARPLPAAEFAAFMRKSV